MFLAIDKNQKPSSGCVRLIYLWHLVPVSLRYATATGFKVAISSYSLFIRTQVKTYIYFVWQSDVMSCMYKLMVRERTRGCSCAGAAWARLCCSLGAHADGAAALLAVGGGARGAVCALAAPLRARLLPAIAHAASHHRVTFLQSRKCQTHSAGAKICFAPCTAFSNNNNNI